MGEAELRDYQTILDFQQDGIAVLDQKLSIKYINPTALALLNLTFNKSLGDSFPFSLNLDSPLETSIGSEPPRWIRLTASEISWQGEKSILVQIRDISDCKREEKRLSTAATAAETRAAELEALKFVAGQLNQIVLRDDAILAGLETALVLFRAEMAWVLLPEENGTVQMFAASHAPSTVISEKRILAKGFKSLWLEKALNGELSEPRMLDFSDCMDEIGFKSSIPETHYAIPLRLNDKPLGLLNLVPIDEKELDFEGYKLLKTIGQQFSLAIQPSIPISLAIIQGNYPQAASLTGRSIADGLDLTAVMKNVLKLAVELTGAEAGSLGLLNSSQRNLSFGANFPETIPQQIYMRSDDLLWEVVDTGKPVLLRGDLQTERLPMFFAPRAKSMVLVPVCVGNKILGLMALYSLSEDRELNEFNEAVAVSLGKQVGNTVQNAQLFMEVQQLTITDPLTGLHNQKSFITQAVREMERTWRYKRPLSLISIVIDDIRSINDRYGREVGDNIMQVLGQICTESLRKVDIIGRYTGNNFIILLPETDATGARDVAERLRMKTESWRHETSEGPVTFSISLGIADLAESEVIDLERFIDRANQALYTALQSGGNRALVWEPAKKKH